MASNSPTKPCDGLSAKVSLPDENSRSMEITRNWTPKDGPLGYFAHDRYGLLPLVCLATATKARIEKIGDETCIQVRGPTEWEVNEAMENLDGLASVMNLTDVPHLATMVLAPQNDSLGYLIENYAAIDWLNSSPRVLLDVATPIGEVLGKQVPVAYCYNTETRKWELVEHLRNSSSPKTAMADEPETTRAWVDFRFPATGSSNASSGVLSAAYTWQGVNVEAGSNENPYLRSSKADGFLTWVQDATFSYGGERTVSPNSALLHTDGSVPNSKSSTKEATVPHRPGGIRTPMTRVAYGPLWTTEQRKQWSRWAPVSRPSSSAPTRPEPPLVQTLPMKSPAKLLAQAIFTMSLPRQANTPEKSVNGAVNKPTPKAILSSKSSLRPTAPIFIPATQPAHQPEPLRGKENSMSSLHASSTLRSTAPVFLPAAQRDNQSEALPTSPTLRKPGVLTMSLIDLPIVEETEDIPVKVAGTACAKTISPIPGHAILIDFGSPKHSPPVTIQQEAIGDDDLLVDASWPVKADNVAKGLLNTPSLEGSADEELMLYGRDSLDTETLLSALTAEDRAHRIHSADNWSWLMNLPGAFDRLKLEEPNINLSPAEGVATYQSGIKLALPDNEVKPKPSETKGNSWPPVGYLRGILPALGLPKSLARAEKGGKGKEREVELPEAPVLHRTMNQMSASNPIRKVFTQPEALMETKTNAVISKALEETPRKQHLSSESCVPGPSRLQANSKTNQMKQKLTAGQKEQTKYLFKTIEPLLSAAVWYPGPLSLDITFGLLLLSSSPSPAKKKFLSLNDLKDYLKNGPASPGCRVFDRLTTVPADIDHIINLEVENCRLFDEKPEQQTFQYEFHCELGAEQFLVVIDQSQKVTVPKPPVRIGSVNLNVPGSIWDASLTIHGAVRQLTTNSKEIEEAAEDIFRNMFVEPDRTHARLVLKTAKGLSITKVILQRTTIHRHIRPKGVNSCDNGPYMYLRVKETQDLIISTNCLDGVITAHCAPLKEMVTANRQWWSVSLISPILDATMHRNFKVKLGETAAWKPKCLFGDDAKHLRDTESSEPLPDLPFASAGSVTSNAATLASSIGCAGLGSLLCLAENRGQENRFCWGKQCWPNYKK